MSILMSAARNISKERQVNPARTERLDPDHAASVLHVTSRYKSADRAIKAGCDLFHLGERGEAIYSLVDGWVALYNLLEDGRKQILQFSLPGAILAFVPARGVLMKYSAQALTDVVVGIIPHENLGRLARDNPEFGMQLAGLISQDRGLAYDHLSSIGRRSARERVAYLLLELFIRSRLRWPGHRSEEMYLPLTQEHIGDATGLTGVHVNRVLRDLRKERIAEFHYRRLRILNPDKLVDVAGIDPNVVMSWINDDSSNETLTLRQARSDVPTPVRLEVIRRRGVLPASRSAPPARGRILEGINAT
jgi:CRP/FNR family transcriptional regulator